MEHQSRTLSMQEAASRGGNATPSRFDIIPAEIRNDIFYYAVVEDGDYDVATRWPGITGTCKRFRTETLATYLRCNKFVAHIIDLNDAPLLTWLEKIDSIDHDRRSLIQSLTIFTEGHLVHTEPRPGQDITACFPNFEFWDNIIACIKHVGFKADQINWPSTLLEGIKANKWADLTPFPMPAQLAVEDTLLHDFMFPGLFARHDFDGDRDQPYLTEYRVKELLGQAAATWLNTERMSAGGFMTGYPGFLQNPYPRPQWFRRPIEKDAGWEKRNLLYRKHRQEARGRAMAEKRNWEELEKMAAAESPGALSFPRGLLGDPDRPRSPSYSADEVTRE